MDSGNSGSLPSYSSGGDDEYDSRAADSFSTFVGPPSVAPPLQPLQTAPFDPFSSCCVFQNPNSPIWPRNVISRSEPCNNPADDLILNSAGLMTSFQEASGGVMTATSALDPRAAPQSQTARNPKKRSRASRRAPTTVLTTDTTNFRAMVQEFTGIPAPPFTSSSPFHINRLDLLSSPSSSTIVSKLLHDAAAAAYHHPLFLRRPFPLKLQSPPLLPVSSSSTINTSASGSSTPALLPDHYPLPTLNSNIFHPPNPNLASNFIETNHKSPFPGAIIDRSENQAFFQIPSGFNDIDPAAAGSVDQTLCRLQHLVPSNQIPTRNDHSIIGWSWNSLAGPDEADRHQAQSLSQLVNGSSSAKSTSHLHS